MMPNHDELMAEYAQCQAERARSATALWQITSVFITILALTAIMMGAVLTSESLEWQVAAPIVWGFWLGVTVTCVFYAFNTREERFLQRMALLRMIEIEAALGFRHQLYIKLLREEWDNRHDSRYWAVLTSEEKTYLESGYSEKLFAGEFPLVSTFPWVAKLPLVNRLSRLPRVAANGGTALAALAAFVAFTATAFAITYWLAERGDTEAISPLLPYMC